MSRPARVRLPLSPRTKKHNPRRRLNLRLESLEERAVPATGTLLVQAFVDQNQNGLRDTGESGVAGTALGLASPGGSSSVITGDDGSGSFEVEEGTYGYSASAPAGYTVGGWSQIGTLTITAGQQTTVQLPLVSTEFGSGGDTGTGGTVDPSLLATDGSDLWFSGVPVPSDTEDDSFVPPDSGEGTSDPTSDSWDGSDDQLPDPPADNTGDDPNLPDDLPASEAPAEPTVSLDDLPPELATAYTSSFDRPDVIEVGDGNAPPPDMTGDQFAITDDAPTDEDPTPPPGTPDGSDPTTLDPPPGGTDSGDGSEPPAASDPTAPTDPSVGSGQWGIMPGYHVTSGGYNRHYSQDWSSATGASHYEATITGTIFLQAGPDGQQVPYEQVRVDYSGWNRMGTGPAMPYSGFYAPTPTPVSLNGGYTFFGLTSWGTPITGFGMMGPMAAPVAGDSGYSSSWNDRWDVHWNGNYLAANAVTYQFAQSFSGTDWSTSSFTPSTAADGTQTGTSRNDYGGSYRSDLAESDQAGNLPAAPQVGADIATTRPDDFGAATAAGSTYFRRDFSAGTYSGWSLYTTVTTADGTVLSHPATGHDQADGTTAYCYFFHNTYQVGDRTNAANPAEDRYAWTINYLDNGEYHYTQDRDFPNDGAGLQNGTQTTDSTVSRTILTDLYDVRTSFHREKDGSRADGTTTFRRLANGPNNWKVHVHFVAAADGGALQADSSLVDSQSNWDYLIEASSNADYSLVSKGDDGGRVGVIQGKEFGYSSTTYDGQDHAVGTYTFSNKYAVIDRDTTAGSDGESESWSNNTFTADDDSGSAKSESFGWGTSETDGEIHVHGEFDGATGAQLGGNNYRHDHTERSQTGWTWNRISAPDLPTTTTGGLLLSSSSGDLTTEFTYTNGVAGGTISGTSGFNTTTTTSSTAVGTQRFYDVAPIPRPVGPVALNNMPPFAFSPQRLVVNDKSLVIRIQSGMLTTDLTVQDGQQSGTIKKVTGDSTSSKFTLDHRATRSFELDAHTVIVGNDLDAIDNTVTTTVTNGSQATTGTNVRTQKRDDTTSVIAEMQVRGVGGWDRTLNIQTGDFTQPTQRQAGVDRLPAPLPGPIPGGDDRLGKVSTYLDSKVTTTSTQNADGTWQQTGVTFDIVAAQRGGFTYKETDTTRPQPDGRSLKQDIWSTQYTDEVDELHGAPGDYTFSNSRRGDSYATRDVSTSAVDPGGGRTSKGTDHTKYGSVEENQERGRVGNGVRSFDAIDVYKWNYGSRNKSYETTNSQGTTGWRSSAGSDLSEYRKSLTATTGTGQRRLVTWWELVRYEKDLDGNETITSHQGGGPCQITVNDLSWGQLNTDTDSILNQLWQDFRQNTWNPAANWVLDDGDALLQITFGVVDGVIGLCVIFGSGGAGVLPGVGLLAVGIDQIIAGGNKLATGEQVPSLFEYAGQQAAGALGAGPQTAQFIGSLTPAVLSLGFGGWGNLAIGAARATRTARLLGRFEWEIIPGRQADVARARLWLEDSYSRLTGGRRVITDIYDPTDLGLPDSALGWTNPRTGTLYVFFGEQYGIGPRIEELIHYHSLYRLDLLGSTEAQLRVMRIGRFDNGIDFLEREAENIMQSIGFRPRR